jgi:hypothetical protein
MWGKGVREGMVYNERMYNISFAQTLTTLLEIEKPVDATGAVLKDALEDSTLPD